MFLSLRNVFLAWLSVAAFTGAPLAAAETPPNIVLVYADDLGYGDLGCYGQTRWKTPHLDRLAREGVRFTDFYTAQAVCSSSRVALLTGCYPNRLGIVGALGPKATHGIHDGETTLAELCRSRGYATACLGAKLGARRVHAWRRLRRQGTGYGIQGAGESRTPG